MNESAQGNNPGDLIDIKRGINIHNLVNTDDLEAQYRVLDREFSEKAEMKEELVGLGSKCQRLLASANEMLHHVLLDRDDLRIHYRGMKWQGTPISARERLAGYHILKSQQRKVEEAKTEITVELDDMKAVSDTIDQRMAEIKAQLQDIKKKIQMARPEGATFNLPGAGDI